METTQIPGVRFNEKTCRFHTTGNESELPVEDGFPMPLSVIVQVTRRCNLNCVFCSETQHVPDPSLETLTRICEHLRGVERVYVSGGEPLLRDDIVEVAHLFKKQSFVGLPTNAMLHNRIIPDLAKAIDFVTVGLEGPRNITTRVRGDYDQIMDGVKRFQELGVPLALCSVVMKSTVDCVPLVCQIADMLGARKVKLVLPVRKGNAIRLAADEYLSHVDVVHLFDNIREQKVRYGWVPKITLTAWTPDVEGYSILVYPDARVYAWPVYDAQDKVQLLGDLLADDIRAIWERNPFRANHVRKYLGRSIFVC